jgi:hypothetical protein
VQRTKNSWSGELCHPQHGVELGFGDSEPVRCQSAWSGDEWWVFCSPNVMDGVVTYLALDFGGAREVWKLGVNAVD